MTRWRQGQCRKSARSALDESQAQQLASDCLPGVAFQVAANAISGKFIVAALTDHFRVRPAENIDNVIQAETESVSRVNAIDAGKEFLRVHRSVESFARLQTIIATVAWHLREFFTEIFQQRGAPAFTRLGVMDHLLKLRPSDRRFLFALFIDEVDLLGHIAGAEKQYAFSRQTVAPGPACLLIIALQIFRQIIMHNETDVRLIDAHSERDGCGDHADIVAQERFLMFCALCGCETSVIRFRADAIFVKIARQRIGALATRAINDAAVVRPAADERQHLFVGRRFGNNTIGQVRPVEAGDVAARIAQVQLLNDVDPHPLGSRGGERHDRHFGQMFPQFFQLTIFRAEIVTPFADAMRFIDCDLRDVPVERAFQKRLQHQSFWRDVKHTVFATVKAAPARGCFLPIQRGIQVGRRDPAGLQRIDLIFHERNERRNYNGQPLAHQRRQLKTKRLPAACRHQHEHIPSRQRIGDDLPLQRPEFVVPEVPL